MLNHISIKYFKLAVNASSYKTSNLDIACKCPICGDSKKKSNSKRLHLYKKGDLELVNCFNAGCSVQNKTVYSFLRDFYPDLLSQYKKETFGNKIEYLKQEQTLGSMIDKTIVKEKQSGPVVYDLKEFFEPLTDPYKEYLAKRGITPNIGGMWYKGKTNIKIGEITYAIKDYLVVPLYYMDKCYGFYSRDINAKTFITFISTPGYKVWNWYGINKEKSVYIFEAIFDAISSGLHNIVANLGAKIPNERLKELKEPVFVLDNDKTGIEMSIEYAKAGHKVYVQPAQYKEKDFNELMLNRPDLDLSELIKNNTFTGISAVTRLKALL